MISANGEPRGLSGLRWLTVASLAVLAAGFIVLLAYCVMESSRSPGSSLVDAYWVGRLPWIAVAVVMIVIGATMSALIGATTTLWAGRWQRLLLPPPLLLVALWWFTALAMSSMQAVPRPTGEPYPVRPPDPVAFAYAAPTTDLLFLVLPALFIVALALVRQPQRKRLASV